MVNFENLEATAGTREVPTEVGRSLACRAFLCVRVHIGHIPLQ